MEDNKTESFKERYDNMDKMQRFGARAMIASVILGVAAIGLAVGLIVVNETGKSTTYKVNFAYDKTDDSIVFDGAEEVSVNPGFTFGEINKPSISKNFYTLVGWAGPNKLVVDDNFQINRDLVVTPVWAMDTIENSDRIYAYIEKQKQWASLAKEDNTILTFVGENGNVIPIRKDEFNDFISVGAKRHDIPENFLAGCTAYNHPFIIPSSTAVVGNNFMKGCTAFNSPIIIPDNVSIIGDDFLAGCTAFNQNISISWDLTTIGNNFMKGCTAFNSKLTFPTETTVACSLTYIGDNFMEGCVNFTNNLTPSEPQPGSKLSFPLPKNLTHLGGGFLHNCDSFMGIIVVDYLNAKKLEKVENEDLSFANDNPNADQVITGITVRGSLADAFLERFGNVEHSRNLHK